VVAPAPGAAEPGAPLAGTLDEARARGFVGRRPELGAFAGALAGSSDARVLLVHGPGGIGKSTLLDAFARESAGRGHPAVRLDGREVDCSAAAVGALIEERTAAARVPDGAPPVLLVDGYELLHPLDRWFREELVRSRPAGSLTVLAGRTAPATGWWLDPGWRRLVRVLELGRLDAAESAELLARLGVEPSHRAAMAELGRGYPLVLAMLAEAGRTRGGTGSGAVVVPSRLADAPDVVGRLCAMIVDDVPSAAHRTGLATCAHATRTTEDLLARTLGERAGEVWQWLESRPYVRRGDGGLYLHEVVREVFEAEFAERAPQAYTALHRTVRQHFLERMADPAEPRPDRAAAEILLIHRRSPLAEHTAQLRNRGLLSVSPADPRDRPDVVALVERSEGTAAAEIARWWLDRPASALYVVRSDAGIEAFSLHTYLPEPGAAEHDPVVGAVLDAIGTAGPLRPGERIHLHRFSGAAASYSRAPELLLSNGTSSMLEWARRPAAWTVIAVTDPDHWDPYLRYLGLSPMVDVEYAGPAGPRRWSLFGWDRRRFGVAAFLELMARRELSGETGPPPAELVRPAPMSRAAFGAAVRGALRALGRPDVLRRSPLVATALVDPAAADPAEALRASLVGAVAAVGEERHGTELRRVLEQTFRHSPTSQEAAAASLHLSLSTYRRHLARATDRLVEILWATEIGEPGRTRNDDQ
jgi:AAA ATPase domain